MSFAAPPDAPKLSERLEAASGIDADAVSLNASRGDVFVYAATREAVEAAKTTAWESIRSLGLTPTLVRVDEWLAESSCWSSEPPLPTSSTGNWVIEGLLGILGGRHP